MTNEVAGRLLKKLANNPVSDADVLAALGPARQAAVQNAQHDEWAKLFTGSLGLGGVLAGLAAYRNAQLERKPKRVAQHIRDVPIPYAASPVKEASIVDAVKDTASTGAGMLYDLAKPIVAASVRAVSGAPRMLYTPDAEVTDHRMLSTYPVGAGAAILGGLYLGNTGVGKLMSKLQKSRQNAELEKKREEYRQELMQLNRKTASTLTQCYGHAKQASLGNLVRNASLLAATAALPLGFKEQYERERKFSDRKALESALRLRARMRAVQQPSDLFASLEPAMSAENPVEPPGE